MGTPILLLAVLLSFLPALAGEPFARSLDGASRLALAALPWLALQGLPSQPGSHARARAWISALGRAADAVREAHPDDVERIYEQLESIADAASSHAESALAVNLRNVLEALAPVAAAQPVRVC